MNRNLRTLRHWIACGLALPGIGLAWAQMPVPLLDTAAIPATVQQLEALLQCKAGTVLKTDEVESKLRTIGLVKGADGFLMPSQKSPLPPLFGDVVVAALVTAADGENRATVYLKRQAGNWPSGWASARSTSRRTLTSRRTSSKPAKRRPCWSARHLRFLWATTMSGTNRRWLVSKSDEHQHAHIECIDTSDASLIGLVCYNADQDR